MSRRSFVLSSIVLVASAVPLRAQHCEMLLATLDDAGVQGTGMPGASVGAVATNADGRYVAFWGTHQGLIPGFTHNSSQFGLVVRDTWAGRIERIDVGPNGESANPLEYINVGSSGLSGDGRYVAFSSRASNLVAGDTNPTTFNDGYDVFVRDRWLAVTTRVSVRSDGTPGNQNSINPRISADGRFVVFESGATNLVDGDTNGATDVFVHDRTTGTIERVSVDPGDVQGQNGAASLNGSISDDGRFVVFSSLANLGAPQGSGPFSDVFCKDRQTGAVELVSISSWGQAPNNASGSGRISGDGRYVVFITQATNVVIEGGGGYQVYRHDRVLHETVRVSVRDGAPNLGSAGGCLRPSISRDGGRVTFESYGNDLVPNDSGIQLGVYSRDMLLGITEEISRNAMGVQGDADCTLNAMSADGRVVAFESASSNLLAGDSTGPYVHDVFVTRRDCLPPSSTPYCFGTGSACPCGNGGAGPNGCASSINPLGANLVSIGLAASSTDTFVLIGTGLSNAAATYFQGNDRTAGGLGTPFGDGLRCASGSVRRLGVIASPGGTSRYPGASDLPISVRGAIPAGGGVTRTYQCWYRNAANFCTPSTFNLTNAVETTWIP